MTSRKVSQFMPTQWLKELETRRDLLIANGDHTSGYTRETIAELHNAVQKQKRRCRAEWLQQWVLKDLKKETHGIDTETLNLRHNLDILLDEQWR